MKAFQVFPAMIFGTFERLTDHTAQAFRDHCEVEASPRGSDINVHDEFLQYLANKYYQRNHDANILSNTTKN